MANCGVYAITNTLNGHAYIGSSVNISQRWRAHVNSLNKNEHHSDYLQRAWNKYGADSFEFTVILLCDKKYKLYFEQVLLDGLKPAYNVALDASAPMQGLHHTEDEVRRMSERQKGKTGALNPMFGRHHSEEARALMSMARKGKRKSEEHKRKIGAAQTGELNHMFGKHPANFGKPMSEEQKLKLSLAMKGKPSNRLGKRCTEETRLKISLARKGKSKGNTYALGHKHTEETRERMRAAKIGHLVTEETRRKTSESVKRYWADRKAKEAQMQTQLEAN